MRTQVELHKPKSVAPRYNDSFKQFALTIYFMGPKAYNKLSETIKLPSRRSLSRITENWPQNPGLNDILFEAIAFKTKDFHILDKNCSICIDEMSIKSHFFYNISKDEIIGFDNTQKTKLLPAKNVFVIIVQGLQRKWKQPLGYFFVRSTFSAVEVENIIIDCIKKLQNIGLNVRAVISDQGSNFLQLSKNLKITPLKPYFVVNSQHIYYMFDTPHLLKSLRNNLMKYKIHFEDRIADWNHIKFLYEKDSALKIRNAPKLTKMHIYPNSFQKMNVSLAAQIFSHTVAASLANYISFGKLPIAACGTVEFIERIDNLFDMMNSAMVTNKKIFSRPYIGSKEQKQYLTDMAAMFKKLNLHDKFGTNCTNKIKCIFGWQITINSVLGLFEELNENGLKYLLTRRLNQDALENFFGKVRQQGGSCINPTPIQFTRAFKQLVGQHFFSNSIGTNCEEDDLKSLDLFTQWKNIEVPKCNLFTQNLKTNLCFEKTTYNPDYRTINLPEINAFTYFCGYIYKKCLEQHNCSNCFDSANTTQLTDKNVLIHLRSYNENHEENPFGNMCSPSEDFIDYLLNLETKFLKIFQTSATDPGIGIKILNVLKEVNHNFLYSCEHFPIEYLLKLFIRVRIYYSLKFFNKQMAETKARKCTKLLIIKHL